MEQITNKLDNMNIENKELDIPQFIKKMTTTQLENEIKIILQSDQRILFNTNNLPPKITKTSRNYFEIELYEFLKKLQDI